MLILFKKAVALFNKRNCPEGSSFLFVLENAILQR